MKRKTVKVDLPVQISKDLRSISETFNDVLATINSLYSLQQSKDLPIRDERVLWNNIPEALKLADISDDHIQNLKKGIFDLYPITINSNNEEMDLVLGKVFASEGDRTSYYCGVAGVVNNSYKAVLEQFDSRLEDLCNQLETSFRDESGSIKDKAPDIKCIDVFSLSGAFDVAHKPICIFFSGENPENISTLSNMTVFANLYSTRFKALTFEIARGHLLDFDLLQGLSDSEISELLLIWLRGHDVGHFIGEDNLGKKLSQFDKDYMILHELKSDIIALYSFRLYKKDLLNDGLAEKIYALTVAEMLRYIRRGDILKYPDSASAYLAWCYFEQNGAITYDSDTKKYKINFALLEQSVSAFVRELLDIFKGGDVQAARELVGRFGSLENLDDSDCFPKDCAYSLREVLNDSDIAYFIDYNFQVV